MALVGLLALAAACAGSSDVAPTAPFVAPNVGSQQPATIVAGGRHSCRLTSDGKAYCWGDGSSGQLGNGNATARMVPSAVAGTVPFASLAAGEFSTCALGTTGAAYCWGDVAAAPSDGAAATVRNSPQLIEGGRAFSSLATGYYHACGLTAAGVVYCWGSGFSGQLGDGSVIDYRAFPAAVAGGVRFVSVSGGYWHTCGVSVQGAAYCWGNNNWAQLGDSTRTAHGTPAPVSGAVVFAKLAAGGRHTCGLSIAGEALCWGWNAFGQLGDGTAVMRLTPTPVVSSNRLVFSNIFAGWYHTCGLTATGAAHCWGFNSHGQLGDGTTTNRAAPTAVAGGLSFAVLAPGVDHTCGVTTTGAAYCWGSNAYGQLGDGTTTDAHVPVLVSRIPGST